MDLAARDFGRFVRTLFFPAGNSIAMKTEDLNQICRHAYSVFPNLQRITVYGSAQYILLKGLAGMQKLAAAGLGRIHVGLESGDDDVLRSVCKGASRQQQIEAGQLVMAAGIELSLYVLLGIGGKKRSLDHARATASALNQIQPSFIRLRTFLPKKNTPLLADIIAGTFEMLGPHAVLMETREIIKKLEVHSELTSDHYTNYINLQGKLPLDKARMIAEIDNGLQRDESSYRPVYIGEQ